MDAFKARASHGPEYYIQNKWVDFLTAKGWLVERLIGNAYQTGIPDLYLAHPKYGSRWVDIKVYGSYNFTKAQKYKWPLWEEYGIGIWIIGAKDNESCTKNHMIYEHEFLLGPPNWRKFWRDSWDKKEDLDALLDDCIEEDKGVKHKIKTVITNKKKKKKK